MEYMDRHVSDALWILVVVSSGFVVGVGIFCLVTWRWLARVAPVRTRTESTREFLREVAVVLLTQPLLPFYYLLGRGRSVVGGGMPVILVHGYFQNRVDFLYLRRALRSRGVRSVLALNYPWWDSIEENSLRLGRFVESVLKEADVTAVALVGHSMGGLIALDYVVNREGSLNVACCVTLGSPHEGVLFRGPLLGRAGADLRAESRFLVERTKGIIPVPCLSIASEHDNIVYPAARASLTRRGGSDALVKGRAHLGILFDPGVADMTAAFLQKHARKVETAAVEAALEAPLEAAAVRPEAATDAMPNGAEVSLDDEMHDAATAASATKEEVRP